MNNKIATLCLSGGMDSTSLLLHLIRKKYSVYALTFNYGQKHSIEISKATKNVDYLISRGYDITHNIIDIKDSAQLLSSSLTNNEKEVPSGYYEEENMKSTVVPNRNAIFISFLYGHSLSISNQYKKNINISLGVHSGDHAIYPDCRKEFYDKILDAFEIGNWNDFNINLYLPYLNFNKSDILKDALNSAKKLDLSFNTIFENTITSYSPDKNGISKGDTGSDIERILAFNDLGLIDPIKYQNSWNEVLNNAKKIEKKFKSKIKNLK